MGRLGILLEMELTTKNTVYEEVLEHSPAAEVVVPPDRNAVYNDKNNKQRNRNILEIELYGCMGWQRLRNYGILFDFDIRHPQTNGICERFHKTMKNEFYDIAFRKKVYSSVEELQTDVNEWLQQYNQLRPHSGRYCYGKTLMQTFSDSKHIAIEKNHGSVLEISDNTIDHDLAA